MSEHVIETKWRGKKLNGKEF